jgi:hypothetical protein
MERRGTRTFILGILVGGAATVLALGALGAAWAWHEGLTTRSHAPVLAVLPVQDRTQNSNPNEFIPLPNTGNDRGPGPQNSVPGFGDQNCDRILYYYEGRLYQLRPGPTHNGENPEFFFMEPYQGPAIPGFPMPGPMIPGAPMPGQPVPPTFKF